MEVFYNKINSDKIIYLDHKKQTKMTKYNTQWNYLNAEIVKDWQPMRYVDEKYYAVALLHFTTGGMVNVLVTLWQSVSKGRTKP
jgi:hypothetical protein